MPRCVAIGCNENGKHSFSKDLRLKKLWERATKIKTFKAKPHSRLCFRHFKESDYESITSTTGLPATHSILKKGVIPSIFPWHKPGTHAGSARDQRCLRRSARKELFLGTVQVLTKSEDVFEDIDTVPQNKAEEHVPEFQLEIEIEPICDPHVESTPAITSMSTQTPHTFRLLSNEQLLSDPKSIQFYKGLENYDNFKLVLFTLLPMANHLHYRGSQLKNISIEDQFLLLLIKIKRNKTDFELGKFFDISATEVGNIFITWVNFIYEMWSKINIWPSRALVDYYMPPQFKKHNSKTRLIVDGTGIPIARPKNPKAQQATFSSYKHHNTVKFLVGATLGGLFSFCTEGYAGSTSDRQMTERSTLLKACEKGDVIMADRGFNVQDLFADKDVSVLTPTFMRGLTQLPGIKLKHDRQLAANRIYIERLIGLTKTYKILKSDVNSFYVPLLSRFFFICVMLCNFRNTIVK